MTLWGNHESNTFRLYKEEVRNQFGLAYGVEDVEVYPLRMNNVVFLGNHQEIFIGKQRIILNHFSLRIWHKNNSKHKSPAWMLSGHSHNSDKGRNPDSPYGKAVDVGIDWGNIWSFNEISDIMSTKTVEILDHHDSHTT